MPLENNKRSGLPEELKLALTYSEESSKRTRSVVFILQLAAVLVLASLWQQTDYDWLKLRLAAARNAVKFLTCEPEQAYIPDYSPDDPRALSPNEKQDLSSKLSGIKEKAKTAEPEDQYMCGLFLAEPKSQRKDEEDQARDYLKRQDYSLTQVKKNVSDLQQLTNSRVLGVSVPVLGIVFDVNDLSVIAGLTFSILLSWFYFNLRRQLKNIRRVFFIARTHKENGKNWLEAAYYLLAMTQVLTIPPGSSADSRNVSFIRRLSRLPSLIMWTAALAQMFVLIDDFKTLSKVDYLSRLVNRAETSLAVYLFIYILYRTIKCFELIGETHDEWTTAYNEISNEAQLVDLRPPNWLARWLKASGVGVTLSVLCFVLLIHILDEVRPGFIGIFKDMFFNVWSGFSTHLSVVTQVGLWTVRIVALSMVLLCIYSYRRKRLSLGMAWMFTAVAVLDVVLHTVKTFHEAAKTNFQHSMEGFYSSPILIVLSLYFLFVLSERTHNPGVELRHPMGDDPEKERGNQAAATG